MRRTANRKQRRAPKRRKVPKVTLAMHERAAAGDERARAIIVGRYLVDLGASLPSSSPLPLHAPHARLIASAWDAFTSSTAERRLDFLRMLDLRARVEPLSESAMVDASTGEPMPVGDADMVKILRAWPHRGKAGPKARGVVTVWERIAAWWKAHRGEDVTPREWMRLASRAPAGTFIARVRRPRQRVP